MKYVTKFLCAIAITAFFTSCASSGSGCYDFGDNTKMNMDQISVDIEIVSIGKKINKMKDIPTICVE